MKTPHLISALLLISSLGCSTINFQTHDAPTQPLTVEEWHHIGIIGLVEFSDPVSLADRCGGAHWSTVRTETGFLQGLVRAIVGPLYAPMSVEIACHPKTAKR